MTKTKRSSAPAASKVSDTKTKTKAVSKGQRLWTDAQIEQLNELVAGNLCGVANPLRPRSSIWDDVAAELSASHQCERTAKQCREKWKNFSQPGIQKTGNCHPSRLQVVLNSVLNYYLPADYIC